MTDPVSKESDRRTALRSVIGLAAAPSMLPMIVGMLGLDAALVLPAQAAGGNSGAQPDQGDLVYISGASAPTRMIAEWFTGDVNFTSGPFHIAASKAAYEKAPATAARCQAKLYDFPSGSLRTLTFKKGGPVQHLITLETEIYVLSGKAILTPIPGHPGKPVTVRTGDALFLPSGYLNSPNASEDFTILQAFVSRTVREARKTIVTARQAAGGAAQDAQHASMKIYTGEGNAIRVVTLYGGPGKPAATGRTDVLVYVAKGRARRNEGGQVIELVAGDCLRKRAGSRGHWEPLEETVLIETDAPLNPGMLPPANT